MTPRFDFYPAGAVRPFVKAQGDGIVFSTIFHRQGEHGLQLIHIPDGETVYIPLTEEYRVGRVFSVRISPFDENEWLYRYRCDDLWILDPHAVSVLPAAVSRDGIAEEVTACSCSPLKTEGFFEGAPEKPLPPADWSEQVIYGLHVKGFTASQKEGFPDRGTFRGIIHMIPYLKDLGITAVELMPVYTPLPDLRKKMPFRTMQEALGAWPVGPQGDPLRDMKERPNYWGFGRGLYFSLRPEFGSQQDFALMVHSLHRAGIRVLMQVYYEKGVSPAGQIEILQYYVQRFGVDGFRLLGHVPAFAAGAIALAPSLSDTALLFHDFPFEEMTEAAESERLLYGDSLDTLFQNRGGSSLLNPSADHFDGFPGLLTCRDDFQSFLRRFVKSDDYVLKDFLKLFLGVPEKHGAVRFVTGYEGFTLSDLVSYNERHNEANGEFGLDGRADNYSWNCGEEGESSDPEVLRLRRRQIRNFLTLVLLAQGTPMLRQGDERCHSQNGNNNPYCQDNEISWIDWEDDPERRKLTAFVSRLTAFRREHPIFRSRKPFQYIDYLGLGHPDVSLHGSEAWMPDLGAFSHSIGISYCENYASDETRTSLKDPSGKPRLPSYTYLAVNMYWKELSLALPILPPRFIWKVFMDTDTEEGFLDKLVTPADQHSVTVAPRSIRLLRAVPDIEGIQSDRDRDYRQSFPAAEAALHRLSRYRGDSCRKISKYAGKSKSACRILRKAAAPRFRSVLGGAVKKDLL